MVTFERRSLLFAATGAFVFAGAAPVVARDVSASSRPEAADPADTLTAMLRMQHRLDGRDAPWWYFGRIYAMLPGRSPLPLFRYEGLEISRVLPAVDGEYPITGVTTSFFLDWRTKERLSTFDNPVSGRRNTVQPNLIGGREGFIAVWYSARGARPGRMPAGQWQPDGLHVTWDHYGDEVWLSHDRSYPPGLPAPMGEASVARARLADLRDAGRAFVPASFSSTYFAPYPSWMEMQDQPGYVIWHADGVKLESVDDLPAHFRRWMEDGYSDRLHTPPMPE